MNTSYRATLYVGLAFTVKCSTESFQALHTLGQDDGLRRVKPCSWSVYRSSSSSPAFPPPSLTSASTSNADATGRSCGNRAGKGRAARSSDAADTVLRVKSGGRGEASHLGAVAAAGEGPRARPAISTGGPRRGQTTNGIGLLWSESGGLWRMPRHSLSPFDTDQWANRGTSMGRVCDFVGPGFGTPNRPFAS